MTLPPVTLIVPVLDEIGHIDACLDTLLEQAYPGDLTVVVAEGGSADGTRERLEERMKADPRISMVGNPHRVQSLGCNLAAAAAPGEILVRADADTRYAPDYVRRSVETLLETGATAAGGPMVPVGSTPFERAVAAAMGSPLTMGPGKFHHATERTEADTVYLGAFRKDEFLALGGYRAFPARAAEDADLYHRWRRIGGTIVVDPAIRSEYTPRGAPGALWRQYWRYGQAKAEMAWVNRRFPSWRPLAPLALVAATAGALVVAIVTGVWWPLATVLGTWLGAVAVVALTSGALGLRVVAAAAIMHWAYGLGLAWGFVRGPRPVRRMLETSRVGAR